MKPKQHDLTPWHLTIGLIVPDNHTQCDGCHKAVPNSLYHKKQLDAKFPWCRPCLDKNRPRYNALMKAREEEGKL